MIQEADNFFYEDNNKMLGTKIIFINNTKLLIAEPVEVVEKKIKTLSTGFVSLTKYDYIREQIIGELCLPIWAITRLSETDIKFPDNLNLDGYPTRVFYKVDPSIYENEDNILVIENISTIKELLGID